MNISTLQTFLEQTPIPEIRATPKTFLGIARQPHYENVMSNIYAFFFDVNEEHGFGDLFVSSFLQLINSKVDPEKKVFAMSNGFTPRLEYGTKKGGRIDLLLHGEDVALIIENKVYHTLNNDLEDYWDTILSEDKYARENMCGIVLSLHPISNINHPEFVNITHIDFLKAVMKNLESNQMKDNEKYMFFLHDFYQNTLNLSNANMDKKNIGFYLKHMGQINQALIIKHEIKEFAVNKIEAAGHALEDIDMRIPRDGDQDRLRWYCSKHNENLAITVSFEELMTKGNLSLHVEMWHELKEDRKRYKDIIFTERDEKALLQSDFYTTKNPWYHFASTFIENISEDQFWDLDVTIQNKLSESKLLNIFRKIEEFLFTSNAQ
ncbi:hypothetical protein Oweho_3561 [Owenweeksia hongkongensis DSM 17368]|uniref:PD-(D/E)XK nuclease superfamily protein n=1 Tax=Owenweeksia hongkongensis (strain DSM 17368 / CIP 108786 / JCM 12287 / NRRL B-23963 / UST20020801) TaxID=926562 RepID=G8R7A2_OWEHD|nr:PD-(D/E)XK nuclease family protein [Owenweeksia hongkongensis]AEV34509.1 hypothetical protein Oweho_3561 [Owenweeksia hongkongensis DSM 17368]